MTTVDYDLEQINPERYRCVFMIPAEGKTFRALYKMTRRSVKRKAGKEPPKDHGAVEQWSIQSIPEGQRGAFLRQLDIAGRGFFKKVVAECASDDFHILNRTLEDAVFMKQAGGDLLVKLVYEGDCKHG